MNTAGAVRQGEARAIDAGLVVEAGRGLQRLRHGPAMMDMNIA
jgi:hypothetical protein